MLLVDDDAVVEEIIRSNRMDKRFANVIRIVFEMKLIVPVEFFVQKLDALVAGICVLSILEDNQGDREEPARSFVELKARVAGFVDEDEHEYAV